MKTYKGLTDNDAFRNYPEDGHGAVLLRVHAAGRQVHEGSARGLRQAAQELSELASTSPRRTSRSPTTTSSNGQLADAEARYKMVLKFPKSSAYWYAMYKMGWIHLNQQRFQEALETFFQVAQATKNDKKQRGPEPRRRRRTSSARTPRSARPTRRSTRSSASTRSYAFDDARRSSPTSTWSRARATRRSTSTAS